MITTHRLLLAVAFLTAAPGLAAQAVIAWGAPTAVATPADIVTTGTFHAAGSGFNADRTVGGVTFQTAPTLITYGGNRIGYTPGTFSSGTAAYNDIMNRGYFTAVGGSANVTLGGLTIGDQYRVQVWIPAWDANFATRLSGTSSVDMGNSITFPTYVIGTFTAAATSEFFSYQGYGGATRGLVGAVSVYNVSAIPEPSVYAALAGAAVLAAAMARRRRVRGASAGSCS